MTIRPLAFLLSSFLSLSVAACAAPQTLDGDLTGQVASSVPAAPAGAPATVSADAERYDALVSAAHPDAAAAGAEMLRAGGSAADAAVATLIALTVVEPQSSGIGGGGFLIYHDGQTGRTYALDGRETAPKSAHPDMFLDPDGQPKNYREMQAGGMAVGVPGNVRLMEEAHKRFGKLPWSRLFQPAIRLAADGWQMSPRLYELLERRKERAAMTSWARATYFGADDRPKPVGTKLTNPALARFLEYLATDGAAAFYRGRSASRIVDAVAMASVNPQRLSTADLSNYAARWRDPLCGYYRGYKVCGMPPPSSGGTTVIALLQQLERFDLASMGADSPEAWHLIAESMRLAFADREAYLGDPDFVKVPTEGLIEKRYTDARSALIALDTAAETVEAGLPPGAPALARVVSPDDGGTSHFATADALGDVASLTSTIESVFGSGLTANGYFLNNELTDFSFRPEKDGLPAANAIAPGKRPRSSMSPTIVYRPSGEVAFAIGAAGGPTIIAQTAKAIIGVIDWGLDIEAAIALPQLYAALGPVVLEDGTAIAPFEADLAAMGHEVRVSRLPLKANGVQRAGRDWIGGADPRGEGDVAGIPAAR